MRRLVLLLALLVLAGCGSSTANGPETTTTAAAPAPPGPGDTLYAGGPWAVVLDGTNAKVYHLIGDVWQRDTSKAVAIRVLGPHGTSPRVAQMGAEISAHEPLVESGLWV